MTMLPTQDVGTIPQQNPNIAGNDGISAQDLMALAVSLASAQQSPQQAVPTANIGGTNILDARQGDFTHDIAPSIISLAQNFSAQKERKQRSKFIESVKTIMGSNSDNDSKIQNLQKLKLTHGTDYGLGVDDIVNQFNKETDRTIKATNAQSKPSSIDKLLGTIQSNQFIADGFPNEFKDEDEVRKYVIRQVGQKFFEQHPELEQAIQDKWAKDEKGFRVGEIKQNSKGQSARYLGNNQWELIDK